MKKSSFPLSLSFDMICKVTGSDNFELDLMKQRYFWQIELQEVENSTQVKKTSFTLNAVTRSQYEFILNWIWWEKAIFAQWCGIKLLLLLYCYALQSKWFWSFWARFDETTLFLTNWTAGGWEQHKDEENQFYFEFSYKISVWVHFGLDLMRKGYFYSMMWKLWFADNILECIF